MHSLWSSSSSLASFRNNGGGLSGREKKNPGGFSTVRPSGRHLPDNVPGRHPFNPVQATQIGLVWRLARRVAARRSGRPQQAQESRRRSLSFIDQSDDSELLSPTAVEVNTWLQNYHAVTGAMPEESEEPSPNQLAALAKRVFRDHAPPYVDFGIFGLFERKLTKSQRCRIFTQLGDGTYLQKDLPGPPMYQGWLAAWRILKTACIMLNVATLASPETYGRHIERLVTQWPSAWGLIYTGEDICSGREDGKTEETVYCGGRAWSSSSTRLGSNRTLELHLRPTDKG